jgi:hypothetical protein
MRNPSGAGMLGATVRGAGTLGAARAHGTAGCASS